MLSSENRALEKSPFTSLLLKKSKSLHFFESMRKKWDNVNELFAIEHCKCGKEFIKNQLPNSESKSSNSDIDEIVNII